MANFVQVYKSTDLNAPLLTGSTKSLVYLLDAVLVNGYNSPNNIVSMTGNGSLTTVTVATTSNLVTGQTVTVAGASIGTMNGTFTITVASGTTFTYASAGNGTPTGTITYSPVLPITSITRVGTTATVTMSQANNTMVTGQWVTVTGATQTDYNVTAQITVLTNTSFTYQVANSPVTPATGTPVYAKAGLQWTKPFAGGTNSQSYRSADATSNKFYLQVIDNAATAGLGKEAQAYGAEVLTADSTPNNGGGAGSGQFPTTVQLANGMCWGKSSTADNTNARAWCIIGDDRTFYYITFAEQETGYRLHGFGHYISYKAGDGYNTFIGGDATFATTNSGNMVRVMSSNLTTSSSGSGLFGARQYTQAGSSTLINLYSNGQVGSMGGVNTNLVFPYSMNQPDFGFYFTPLTVWECQAGPPLRGRMPGLYSPQWNASAWNLYDTITNVAGLSGITLIGISGLYYSNNDAGCAFFDMFGPWN